MRAALYARYSTEQQSAASVEDQLRVCREFAAREGLVVVTTHSDDAISGSTPLAARRGGHALAADLLASRFDVLILEGLDRLSRDQVEQETWVRRMEHRGVRIVGVSDGYDSQHGGRKIMRGVRGLINELYLDDLRAKTHRGQTGRVLSGYVAGGKSYGYRLVRDVDGDRELGSRYEVDQDEARWVVWIFQRYANGASCRRIAHDLNARGVPSPRRSTWVVSAIYGSPVKGSGILNNVLYAGHYVWNRSQWIKDPDSGRRKRVERPRTEWNERIDDELRIVPEELWRTVRARIDDGRDATGRKRQQRPVRTLFGGLIHCPYCGGPMVAVDAAYYGCNVRMDRGATVCPGFRISRSVVDRRMLASLRDEILTPEAAALFEAEFRAQLEDDTAIDVARQLHELDASIARLVDAIASVGHSPAIAARLHDAERRREVLRAVAAVKRKPMPNFKEQFAQALLKLEETLKEDAQAARVIIGELLGRVTLEQRGKEVWAHLGSNEAQLTGTGGIPATVVAGTGFEPVTFGL